MHEQHAHPKSQQKQNQQQQNNILIFLSLWCIGLTFIILTTSFITYKHPHYYLPKLTFGNCLLSQLSSILTDTNPNNLLHPFQHLPRSHPEFCTLNTSTSVPSKTVGFAAVGVVLDNNNTLLLTRRSKQLKSFPTAWVFPGGHLDPKENFTVAMIREVQEETGIQLVYSQNEGEWYYNNMKCSIQPILLYESLYPRGAEVPKKQTLVIYYAVVLPVNYSEVKLSIQKGEIDAYVWVHKELLYNMIFNYKDEKSKEDYVYGYLYKEDDGNKTNVITVKEKFNYLNFRPPYFDNGEDLSSVNETPTRAEYVAHGHRTAIKILVDGNI